MISLSVFLYGQAGLDLTCYPKAPEGVRQEIQSIVMCMGNTWSNVVQVLRRVSYGICAGA